MGMGRSEADRLPDEDDVGTTGQLQMHLQNLADGAVLAVGGIRADVLELQAVLVDPLMCCFQDRDQFLRTDDE